MFLIFFLNKHHLPTFPEWVLYYANPTRNSFKRSKEIILWESSRIWRCHSDQIEYYLSLMKNFCISLKYGSNSQSWKSKPWSRCSKAVSYSSKINSTTERLSGFDTHIWFGTGYSTNVWAKPISVKQVFHILFATLSKVHCIRLTRGRIRRW